MSPIFETDDDKARQQKAADQIARAWRCVVIARPALDPVDWDLLRDTKLHAVAEFKGRAVARSEYPTIYLSEMKYHALVAETKARGVPAFFVVGFSDALCYVNVADIVDTDTEVKGRPSRPGAAHDQEPIIEVPITLFREIKVISEAHHKRAIVAAYWAKPGNETLIAALNTCDWRRERDVKAQ